MMTLTHGLPFLRVALVLIALGAGCSPKESLPPSLDAPGPSVSTESEKPGSVQDYVRTVKEGPYGRLEHYSITPEAFNRRKEELLRNAIRRLDLPKNFNTEVFVLDGYETPGAVIAKPRIFLRSSVTGGRVRLRRGQEEGIVADVSVALVDGLASEISTGKGTRALPEELLVTDQRGLLKAVEDGLRQPPRFVSTIRCPEEIKLRVPGVGLLPVILKVGLKNCPMNTSLPAAIEMRKEEWEELLFAFAMAAPVEVELKVNLALPITLEYAKVSLKKEAVKVDLTGLLRGSTEPFSSERLALALDMLLDRIQNSFGAEMPREQLASLQDAIIRGMFRSASQPSCPNGWDLCFYLKPGSDWLPGEYVHHLRREEYVGPPLLIDSVAPISDYLGDRQELLLRSPADSPLSPPSVTETNQVFRTIQEGEVAEIRIQHLMLGEIGFSNPQIKQVSNQVCVAPFALCLEGRWRCTNPDSEDHNCRPVCHNGWSLRCREGQRCSCIAGMGCCPSDGVNPSWGGACDRRRVCDRLRAPAAPKLPFRTDRENPSAPDFTWDCAKFAQNHCDPANWQDRWHRITTWSLPLATQKLNRAEWKAEYWPRVISGVGIRFSNAVEQGTKSLICPLSALQPRILSEDRLLVSFRNTSNCAPFNEQNRKSGYGPSISLISQIAFPLGFKCGSLIETWEGKRRYICRLPDHPDSELETTVAEDERRVKRGEPLGIHRIYYPRVELQGSLRIVGSSFESGGERQ